MKKKVKACLIAKRANADFVKTSTGFSKGGATAGDVALMRRVVGKVESLCFLRLSSRECFAKVLQL